MNDNENRPRNIFEAINLNIVELSKDFVAVADKIEQIHAALYPDGSVSDKNTDAVEAQTL